MTPTQRNGALAVILLLTCVAFAWRLGDPPVPVFDEKFYVPAARALVQLEPNQNYEHPPLGKLLIGAGMTVAGDTPAGWRVASVAAGVASVAGVAWLTQALYGTPQLTLLAAASAAMSGMLLVMARLAMLDVFVTACSLAGLAAFVSRRHVLAGLAFGGAVACKWSGAVPWGFCVATLMWLRPGTWERRRPRLRDLAALVGLPPAVYALSYVPLLMVDAPGHDLAALFQMQSAMWEAQTLQVPKQDIASAWWEWPLRTSPMWLVRRYTDETQQVMQAVMVLASPIVCWGGLAGIVAVAVRGARRHIPADGWLAALYVASHAIWSLSPRVNGYYYYFLPALLVLAIALARATWLVAAPLGRRRNALVVGALLVAAALWLGMEWPFMTGVPLALSPGTAAQLSR